MAGGLIAAGIVLAGIGFIASGRDQAVLTTQIDMRDNTIVLGGVEVDDRPPPHRAARQSGRDRHLRRRGSRRALGAASPGALPAKLRKPAKPEPQPLRNWPQACADSLSAPRGGP